VMSSRRERIESMLREDPQDTFLRYSLALELQKEGEFERSQEGLRTLMEEIPPYVPAFFMAAQFLAGKCHVDEARSILRAGIDAARQVGDSHAAGEMGEFLASLGASASP